MRLNTGKVKYSMKIGKFIKSKKIKNICITLIEILVIAAVIMGILMAVQSKLKSGSGTGIGIERLKTEQKADENTEEVSNEYYIEVNIKKSAIIVYRYNKDKSDKNPIKVMNASIGKQVKTGKYKLKEAYTWRNESESIWNKYNYKYSQNGWIQSADYLDKYSWTLIPDSYNKIGKNQSNDANIKLYAGDASWIYNNCVKNTVLNIIKGKEEDVLPVEMAVKTELQKHCGWDPTDSVKGNPYKNMAKGIVSAYTGTVQIEKDSEPDLLANLIVLNEKGENITAKLEYKNPDVSKTGKQTVKYKFTSKSGIVYEAEVKYKIIDTTVPIVKLSKEKFTYEVESGNSKDVNKKAVKEAIEALVKKAASASEGTIKVAALPKEQLVVGINFVRVVATDSAGNIGSAQAIVEIKVKEKKLNQKYQPNEKLKQKALDMLKQKETKVFEKETKKEEKTEKDKKEEKTTATVDNETTIQAETTASSEKNTEDITEEKTNTDAVVIE